MTDAVTRTLCPYCGVGCGLDVLTLSSLNQSCSDQSYSEQSCSDQSVLNSQVKVRGDRLHPSSLGQVCVKGATVAESLDKDRLLYPQFREQLDHPFRRISWEEAYGIVGDRLQSSLNEFGPDGICMYGSGQLQTEDYYVAQKLLKACLKTNNFDSNSRLCMSSAVSGYIRSFGSDGPPCCYEDLDLTDCAFIIGSNTAECHPIIFNRLRKNIKKNPKTKLIVIDPRRTESAAVADLHLAIRPGTDIDLLNGIAFLLYQWGALDKNFIEDHTIGFQAYSEVFCHYPPEVTAQNCQISVEALVAVAQCWAESERVLSLWGMGVNQSSEGTAKVQTLVNLHLMTGQLCKLGAGPFSLTGQPNAMGGREAGGLCKLLPGYRLVTNAQHRAEMEQFWGLEVGSLPPVPGRSAWEIVLGLEAETVGLLWIVATNPAVSMPDLERTKTALRKSPFTIHQDAYFPTETASFAHLLLPAAQWGEKTGTMTNSERVVTLCEAFRSPPGDAKADWEIFAEVGRRAGFSQALNFENAAAVFAEFVQSTRGQVCDMTGLSHELLRKSGPLQWPYPEYELNYSSEHGNDLGSYSGDDDDTFRSQKNSTGRKAKRLYLNRRFPTSDGRARFIAYHSRGLAEPPDADYPFILTTGRLYGHWHTQTRTGRIAKTAAMYPHPFLEIHPKDARLLTVDEGQMVEVRSRRGLARVPVKITTAIEPGTVFIPMHWGFLWADQSEANALTHPESCPESLQPELKACAVQIRAIAPEPQT